MHRVLKHPECLGMGNEFLTQGFEGQAFLTGKNSLDPVQVPVNLKHYPLVVLFYNPSLTAGEAV